MTKEFQPFDAAQFAPRYEFNQDRYEVLDTDQNRILAVKYRRGEPPYYRLVANSGEAAYVTVESIFGEKATALATPKSDFSPFNFSKYHYFDFDSGVPYGKPGVSTSRYQNQPAALRNREGWEFYQLRDNDGNYHDITPSEIIAAKREVWEVPLPENSLVIPTFPDVVFYRFGPVARFRSKTEPLIELDHLKPMLGTSGEMVYTLTSVSGKVHKFSVTEVMKVVNSIR